VWEIVPLWGVLSAQSHIWCEHVRLLLVDLCAFSLSGECCLVYWFYMFVYWFLFVDRRGGRWRQWRWVLLWLNDSVRCYSENLSVIFTVNILELNLMQNAQLYANKTKCYTVAGMISKNAVLQGIFWLMIRHDCKVIFCTVPCSISSHSGTPVCTCDNNNNITTRAADFND